MVNEDKQVLEDNVKRWFFERFHLFNHSLKYTGLNGAVSPSTLTLVSSFSNLHAVTEIDLTGSLPGNDLRYLENVHSLKTLILDSCCLNDHFICPSLDSLETLSLNKNNLANLDHLLDGLGQRAPGIQHLSLLGNPLCPHPCFPANTTIRTKKQNLKSQPEWILEMELDYRRYRQFVISHGSLAHLQFLDAQAVTIRERQPDPAVVGKAVETFQSPVESPQSPRWSQGPQAHKGSSIKAPGGLGDLVWQLWNSTKYEWGRVDHARPHNKQAQPTQILEMCEIRSQNTRRHYQVESAPHHDLIIWKDDPHNEQNQANNAACVIMDAPYSHAATQEATRKATEQDQTGGKSFFGKLRYRYSGKNSEGNRFIRNHDL